MSDGSRTRVISPPFRVSFPAVFEPKAFEGNDPKYSILAVWTPSEFKATEKKAWKAMLAMLDEASMEKFGKKLKAAKVRHPLRKGEEKEHLQGFEAGQIFATLSTKIRPGLVDRELLPIIDPNEFYAGCYARATLTAYGYSNVTKGVALGLGNIQKLGDGEPLDGRVAAEDDFGDDAPEWGDQPATEDDDDDLLG